MKYPKHIILDLYTPQTPLVNHAWEYEFIRRTKRRYRNSPLASLATSRTAKITLSTPSIPETLYLNSLTMSNFDINFLRKEKIYTKLKYSRCPQYDIVSGGFAAIFAGFIGFLISEKFGIELVDSGDFYIAFMYGVFAAFSLRPLIRIYSKDDTPYTPISLRYLLVFVTEVIILAINELKFIISKIMASLHIR